MNERSCLVDGIICVPSRKLWLAWHSISGNWINAHDLGRRTNCRERERETHSHKLANKNCLPVYLSVYHPAGCTYIRYSLASANFRLNHQSSGWLCLIFCRRLPARCWRTSTFSSLFNHMPRWGHLLFAHRLEVFFIVQQAKSSDSFQVTLMAPSAVFRWDHLAYIRAYSTTTLICVCELHFCANNYPTR